jgi:membrane protein implicated in regulation of membrane protease activity
MCLIVALVMLIAGETILVGRLVGLGFVVYWMICFGFTGLALMAAFLDARAVRRRIHDEHRKLLESTIKKIEIQETQGPRVSDGNGRPSNFRKR